MRGIIMPTKQRRITVLMLPWLAHGHISPFLELAKKLSDRNFSIYFCSTPVNLSTLKDKISVKYSSSIQFVELHLPNLPELPPHYHTTNGLPPHLMPTLKKAFAMSSPNLFTILKALTPDLVIYDFLPSCAPALAYSQNIPAAQFSTTGAAMSYFFLQDSTYELESDHNGPKGINKAAECNSVGIMLIKSFRELEAKYIDSVSNLVNKKIIPVGSLVPNTMDEDNKNTETIIEWLNEKENASTVFVSFGTEYFLSVEEFKQTAGGLEKSLVNFIWVIRFPEGEDMTVKEALPEGYMDKLGNRGLIVERWAPQGKILRHGSIGGFVSHCGWSSVMESVKFGVPIIAMPMQHDQPVNAMLVADVGVGVEVKRSRNGMLDGEEMAKEIRKVVVDKSGESIRRKAKEMSVKMRDNIEEEIDVAVEELIQLCCKKQY